MKMTIVFSIHIGLAIKFASAKILDFQESPGFQGATWDHIPRSLGTSLCC